MKPDQPATALRSREALLNVECLKSVLKGAGTLKSVLELFGGTGGMTRVLADRFPVVPLISWDKDRECCRLIKEQVPEAEVFQDDSLQRACPREGDGLSMDFNMMTRKRLNEAPWDRLIIPGLKWFPITDSAVSKFHINYRFYGLKEPDFVQYLVQWNQWAKSRGYSLRRVAYHSRAALMGFYPQEGNIERERF